MKRPTARITLTQPITPDQVREVSLRARELIVDNFAWATEHMRADDPVVAEALDNLAARLVEFTNGVAFQ